MAKLAMINLIALLLISTWYVSPSHQQDCTNSAYYNSVVNKQTRLTYLENGNYTIQALLQFSERNSSCGQVSKAGLTQMFSIKYAIDKFNKDPFYGGRATIGLQLDDDCGKLPATMARGIEVVSFHRPNSVCRSDFIRCDKKSSELKKIDVKEASAVIGTSMSFTTIPLSSLMSLYDIPQISASASSRLLSKKDLYKSFFRTIPSDTNQIKAMLAIFAEFKWNYIFAVGSDDDYGKLGISDLKQHTGGLTGENKICIFKDEYIPYQSDKTDAKIKEVVKKIKDGKRAKVVVLFLYVRGIGDKIIAEAKKEGVERIWLTSEAWNPTAATFFSQNENLQYKNQTHGVLSVSVKRHKLPGLMAYMEKQIRENYRCNKWLQSYLLKKHKCNITVLKGDDFDCHGKTDTLAVSKIMDDLKKLPGSTDRLIDAAHSLGLAINRVLNDTCLGQAQPCRVDKLKPTNITAAMKQVEFVNDQGQTISFGDKGDPKNAFYTIENLVYENGQMVYKTVGNWTSEINSDSAGILHLDINQIQWPYWFRPNNASTQEASSYPDSRCSNTCVPGEYVVGRTGCCWTCHKCRGYRNYTNDDMMSECLQCSQYSHTLDNKECVATAIKWLEIDDPAGMSIVIISAIGFLGTVAATIFIAKYNRFVTKHDTSPHMLTFVCVLLLLTFVYGPLHIIEPMDALCKFRNGYFFILLMIYCAFVLVKTHAMTSYLRGHADRSFGGRLLATQLLVLLMFFLLELVSVIAWLYVDGHQLKEDRSDDNQVIWKQCEVEFTAARLVSTFIPCIILIIATFCAFRERNHEHSFYEPKFLSFSCIALCIIIVAFLPTFRYVVGIYKAIVLAYTMNVFGYTFLACLILPKVYVGVIRNRRGEHEYPVKAGASKRKKKKDDKNAKKNNESSQNIDSSIIDSTKTKSTANDNSDADVTDIKMEEKTANGYGHSNQAAYSNGQNGSAGENNC